MTIEELAHTILDLIQEVTERARAHPNILADDNMGIALDAIETLCNEQLALKG